MSTNLYILLSVFLISLLSLLGVLVLSINQNFLKKAMCPLVSFSTGAILGNVFVHIFPEIAEGADDIYRGFSLVLVGIIASFIIEKFIHWRHCHSLECTNHIKPVGPLVLIGDAVHNIVDGVLIATSYLVSIPLGIATTVAVALHEVPQEFGDFVVLVHSGIKRGRALLLNFLSACMAFVGAFAVIIMSGSSIEVESILLPLVAGNFLYIAGSDLIPELHKETKVNVAICQLMFMIAGIGLMYVI